MARKRGSLLVAASLVLGGVAAWMANGWLKTQTAVADPAKATVVVAAIDIPFGTKVEQRHLRTLEMLPGSVPANAFTDPAKVEGKVSTASMLAGEILLNGRFVDHGNGSTLSAVVDKNMRAVTVRVDDVVGVAGFLLPGNRVDVVAARKEASDERAVTETILQNIRVLAVDQTASTDKNEPVVVRAVTLEMTPEQAETLVRGRVEGTIQLTLRNPLDDSTAVPPPAVAAAPAAAPAPKPARVAARPAPREPEVQVIRGTQVRELPVKGARAL